MKAKALLNWFNGPRKPSFWLGFLLLAVLWAFLILVLNERSMLPFGWGFTKSDFKSAQDWIALVAALIAVVGFVVSAMVSINNSVKQHTIKLLLESRLSEIYMQHAAVINSTFLSPAGIICVTEEEVRNGFRRESISYILNYLEFLAVGIKNGELDERLMRKTLRGMVCNVYEALELYVAVRQKGTGPRRFFGLLAPRNTATFENLRWLYKYWYVKRLEKPKVLRPPAPIVSPLATDLSNNIPFASALYALFTGRLP